MKYLEQQTKTSTGREEGGCFYYTSPSPYIRNPDVAKSLRRHRQIQRNLVKTAN